MLKPIRISVKRSHFPVYIQHKIISSDVKMIVYFTIKHDVKYL